MFLINAIRENEADGLPIEEAVDKAVRFCIENDVLKEYLVTHRAEVLSVCLKEFNEEVFVAAIREEGREEGFEEGREEGRKEGRKEGRDEMQKKMTQLTLRLSETGRLNELVNAAKDNEYLHRLFKEFNLE